MKDDRRDFPRIDTEHAAEVVDTDGSVFPVLALDLSLTGMQLLCDTPTVERLLPGGQPQEDTQPEIDVRLRLHLRDGTKNKIRVHCRIMSVREVQHDEYRIGLKFNEFAGDSYLALEAYFDESLPE